MTSIISHYSELTYATYASLLLSKAADYTSLSSTPITNRPTQLGLTHYTAEFLEELLTWRILQVYSPFLRVEDATLATAFFANSSLHHIRAAQLYSVFASEFRLRQSPILRRFAPVHRTFNKIAQTNSATYDTIAQVAADAGISCSAIKMALSLLSEFSEATNSTRTVRRATALTLASALDWDTLAQSLLEDHSTLSDPHTPTSRIVRHRILRLGLSITYDVLPAIKKCKEMYFTHLHGRPSATRKSCELEYVEYRVAPTYQLNNDIGVHLVVQLKRAGLKKRTWKRAVRAVAVHVEDVQWDWSMTTRRSSGSHAPLRRVHARNEPERRIEPVFEFEHEVTVSREEPVDPLRRMKIGEEYAAVHARDGSGSTMAHLEASSRPSMSLRRNKLTLNGRMRPALHAVRRKWAYL